MYHPPAVGTTSSDHLEFLELKNTGSTALDLSGLTFTAGVRFTFSNGTKLAPGGFLILASNPGALAAQYPGLSVHGAYLGALNNGGERITLAHPLGAVIFSVSYDDELPWPALADNLGFSLVPRDPTLSQAPESGTRWRASALPGGSPGTDDPAPAVGGVVINELLAASAPPQTDWIELHNPTAVSVEIGGWFLTDDRAQPKKYRLPDGLVLATRGRRWRRLPATGSPRRVRQRSEFLGGELPEPRRGAERP